MQGYFIAKPRTTRSSANYFRVQIVTIKNNAVIVKINRFSVFTIIKTENTVKVLELKKKKVV